MIMSISKWIITNKMQMARLWQLRHFSSNFTVKRADVCLSGLDIGFRKRLIDENIARNLLKRVGIQLFKRSDLNQNLSLIHI